MKDRQWRNLIKDIQNQRCILMLGPGLSTTSDGIPLVEAFSQYLVSELKSESIIFEEEAKSNLPYIAQRFMTIPDIRRIDLEDEAISFVKKNANDIPEIFSKIAKLPFYLIINTTADNFLQRALQEEGRPDVHFFHYNFKKHQDEKIPSPAPGQVLVYNLLGSVNDPESLIFTKKERVEFIKSVVRGNPALPHKIVSEFDDRKTYLFLGFNIEDWRFPLLLDSLQIETLNSSYTPDIENYPVSNITKSFFEDCYRFRFVENKVAEFVDELVKRFQEETNAETIKASETDAKKIVILYAEEDEKYRDELLKHLSALERNHVFEIWHKGEIDFGADVDATIEQELEKAEVVLCLLSSDFLSSERFFEFEIPKILKRKEEGLKIFPVLIRSADLESGIWDKLPVLPSVRKPIDNSHWDSPDAAYQQIVHELKTNLLI